MYYESWFSFSLIQIRIQNQERVLWAWAFHTNDIMYHATCNWLIDWLIQRLWVYHTDRQSSFFARLLLPRCHKVTAYSHRLAQTHTVTQTRTLASFDWDSDNELSWLIPSQSKNSMALEHAMLGDPNTTKQTLTNFALKLCQNSFRIQLVSYVSRLSK